MHLVAAMDRVPEMRGVLTLFEGVASGAADGYARMADFPAATLLHLGPGFGNAFANVHNAYKARTPMVNVVGDHAVGHKPLGAPLASDIESVVRPVSHWMRTVRDARSAATDTALAVAEARARRGVDADRPRRRRLGAEPRPGRPGAGAGGAGGARGGGRGRGQGVAVRRGRAAARRARDARAGARSGGPDRGGDGRCAVPRHVRVAAGARRRAPAAGRRAVHHRARARRAVRALPPGVGRHAAAGRVLRLPGQPSLHGRAAHDGHAARLGRGGRARRRWRRWRRRSARRRRRRSRRWSGSRCRPAAL